MQQNHWQQQQEQHHPSVQQQQVQPQHQNLQQHYDLQSPGPIPIQQQHGMNQTSMTVNVTGDTPHLTNTTLPQGATTTSTSVTSATTAIAAAATTTTTPDYTQFSPFNISTTYNLPPVETMPIIQQQQQQDTLISNDGRVLQSVAAAPPLPLPPPQPTPKTRSATYSRKDKALGLLAQRLVAMFEARSHAAYEYHHQQQQQQQDFSMTQQHQSQQQQQETTQNGLQGNNGGDTISTHLNDTTTMSRNETTIATNTSNHTNQEKLFTPPSTTTATTITTSTPLLSIDQTASELLVERRRIYDIINILEALNVVTKKGKNVYWWHGLKVLETTFKDLQAIFVFCDEFREDAERNGMIASSPVSNTGSTNTPIAANASDLAEDGSYGNGLNKLDTTTTGSYFALSAKKNPLNGDVTSPIHDMNHQQQQHHHQQYQPPIQIKTTKQANPPKLSSGSLGQLTKKFLSLYLIGYDALSLGEATERLLGYSPDVDSDVIDYNKSPPSRVPTHRRREIQVKGWKTKVRRLYDIANVLCSVGIIDKTSSPLSHKKCGNMLTSDGRAVHCHKNNQYFFWKFHKTPKQLFMEHQSLRLAENVQTEINQNGNGANPLCVNESEQPVELAQPAHPGKEIPVPLEDKSIEVASSIYEL